MCNFINGKSQIKIVHFMGLYALRGDVLSSTNIVNPNSKIVSLFIIQMRSDLNHRLNHCPYLIIHNNNYYVTINAPDIHIHPDFRFYMLGRIDLGLTIHDKKKLERSLQAGLCA